MTGDLVISVHADLAPSPRAAGEARVLVASALSDGLGQMQNDDFIQAAQLIVSELVTNAVLHARTALHVTIDRDERTLLIAVSDGAPADGGLPLDAAHMDGRDAESGRGLRIVSGIADAYGWRPCTDPAGKVVWAVLQLTSERRPRLLR